MGFIRWTTMSRGEVQYGSEDVALGLSLCSSNLDHQHSRYLFFPSGLLSERFMFAEWNRTFLSQTALATCTHDLNFSAFVGNFALFTLVSWTSTKTPNIKDTAFGTISSPYSRQEQKPWRLSTFWTFNVILFWYMRCYIILVRFPKNEKSVWFSDATTCSLPLGPVRRESQIWCTAWNLFVRRFSILGDGWVSVTTCICSCVCGCDGWVKAFGISLRDEWELGSDEHWTDRETCRLIFTCNFNGESLVNMLSSPGIKEISPCTLESVSEDDTRCWIVKNTCETLS